MADQHINIIIAAKDAAGRVLMNAAGAVGSLGDSLGNMVQRARGVVPAMNLLVKSMDAIPGSIGTVVRGLGSMASGFAAFGPAGLVITGAMAGFAALQKHVSEKCKKIEESAKSMISAVSQRIKMQFEVYVNGTKADFDVVAAKIKDVQNSIEGRKRTMELTTADFSILDAKGQAELKALQDEIDADNAANPDNKVVAAANAADLADAFADVLSRELGRRAFNQRLAIDMQAQNARDLESHAAELGNAAQAVADKLDNLKKSLTSNGEESTPESKSAITALEGELAKANAQAEAVNKQAEAARHQLELMGKAYEKDEIDRQAALESARSQAEIADANYKRAKDEQEADETNRANAELLAQQQAHDEAMRAEEARQKEEAEKRAAEQKAKEKKAEVDGLKEEKRKLEEEIAAAKKASPAEPFKALEDMPGVEKLFERYVSEHGGLPADTAAATRRQNRLWDKFRRNVENKMNSIANRGLVLATVGNKMDEVVAAAQAMLANNKQAVEYSTHWDYVKSCEQKLDEVNQKLEKALTVQ